MPIKVLVVDDEADFAVLVTQKFCKQVQRGEIEFLFARNGLEALAQFETTPDIAVVLSDINMPNMTGLEFLKAKSEDPAIKDIPVVMISTETGADIIDEGQQRRLLIRIDKPRIDGRCIVVRQPE